MLRPPERGPDDELGLQFRRCLQHHGQLRLKTRSDKLEYGSLWNLTNTTYIFSLHKCLRWKISLFLSFTWKMDWYLLSIYKKMVFLSISASVPNCWRDDNRPIRTIDMLLSLLNCYESRSHIVLCVALGLHFDFKYSACSYDFCQSNVTV